MTETRNLTDRLRDPYWGETSNKAVRVEAADRIEELEPLEAENEHLRLTVLGFALRDYFSNDAAKVKAAVKEDASEALSYIDGPPPRPELVGAKPLVMYFDNDKDRQEMIDAVAEAKPNMVALPVGPFTSNGSVTK